MNTLALKLKLVRPSGRTPLYGSFHASGADLFAANDEPIVLGPGKRALIPTGISLEIPPGYEVQIRPRSGLAIKHGISMVNSPGTIDADYRGEIMVIMLNTGDTDFQVVSGDRIAQMVLCPVLKATFVEADDLGTSVRGSGGFGSTGY